MLRVLVACEMSARVRVAFAARGWEAWSADLLPDEYRMWNPRALCGHDYTCDDAQYPCPDWGTHYQGDVLDIIDQDWDLVIAHPPCFVAGTPVLTARGIIGIEAVQEGDLVLTHEGRWKPVTATMSREAELVSDGTTTCTPGHPFYSRHPEQLFDPATRQMRRELGAEHWIPAKQLGGEFVAIPATVAPLSYGCPVSTPTIWYAVGRWLGDGWTRNKQRYRNGKPHGHSTDVIICCSFAEGDELEVSLKATGLRWIRSKQRTTFRFALSHAELTRWLEAEFGKYAHGKTVPGWLLGAAEEIRREVLRGYLDADGSEQHEHKKATTVSANLAAGIRILASTLGYTTGSYIRRYNGRQYNIEGRTGDQRDSYSVVIRKDDGRFTELTERHRWIKQRKPFKSAGRGTVYDITVADDHSFVANGFVVHNCTDLSQAGARYWKQKEADGRMQAAINFFWNMYELPQRSAYVVVENPVGVINHRYRQPDQIVEPWWFGDPLTKKICLWYRAAWTQGKFTRGLIRDDLPKLKKANPVESTGRVCTGGGSWRTDKAHGKTGMNKNWEDSQGRARRDILRSITSDKVARAMADQWGAYVESKRGQEG